MNVKIINFITDDTINNEHFDIRSFIYDIVKLPENDIENSFKKLSETYRVEVALAKK